MLFRSEVLKVIAQVLAHGPGHPGRLGGEEFALLLDGWDLLDAHHEAERLRLAVAETPIAGSWGVTNVTISLGVAEHTAGQSVDQLLKSADVALYAAKTSGRNRTVATQAPPDVADADRVAVPRVQTIYLAC